MSIADMIASQRRNEEETPRKRYYELLWKQDATAADAAELRKCCEVLRISTDQLSKQASAVRSYLTQRQVQQTGKEARERKQAAEANHRAWKEKHDRIMAELKAEGCQLVELMQQATADQQTADQAARDCSNLCKADPVLFELAPD